MILARFLPISLVLFFGQPAFLQTSPRLSPFQGRLNDQNGAAVTKGVQIVRADKVEQTLVPPTAVFPSAGNSVPSGWLLCHGQGLRDQDCPTLFEAIGANRSAGVEWTLNNFNSPEFCGMFLCGANVGRSDSFVDSDPDISILFAWGNAVNLSRSTRKTRSPATAIFKML